MLIPNLIIINTNTNVVIIVYNLIYTTLVK